MTAICRCALGCLLAGLLLALLAGCEGPEDKLRHLLEEGRALHDQGRYEPARGKFAGAAQIDPRCAEAQWMLGRIALRLGRYGAARTRLERAVDLDPDNLAARLDLGTYFLGVRDLPRVREQAGAIRAREPANPGGRLLEAAAAAAEGRGAEAAGELDRLVAEGVRLPGAYALRAARLQNAGDAAGALATLVAGIRRLPESAGLHLMLARLLAEDGRYQAAAAVMAKVSGLDPESLDHRLALAGLLRLAGQGAEADVVVDELLAARAGDPAAVRAIARHWVAEGMTPRALEVLRVGLEASPGHPDIAADLAALERSTEAAVPADLRPPGNPAPGGAPQADAAAALGGVLIFAGQAAGPRADPLVAALAGYPGSVPASASAAGKDRARPPAEGPPPPGLETGTISIALWLLGLGLLGLVAVRRKSARKR